MYDPSIFEKLPAVAKDIDARLKATVEITSDELSQLTTPELIASYNAHQQIFSNDLERLIQNPLPAATFDGENFIQNVLMANVSIYDEPGAEIDSQISEDIILKRLQIKTANSDDEQARIKAVRARASVVAGMLIFEMPAFLRDSAEF
jgi:hypothetical protein